MEIAAAVASGTSAVTIPKIDDVATAVAVAPFSSQISPSATTFVSGNAQDPLKAAFLTYSRVDMCDNSTKYTFGRYNPRPANPKHVENMVENYKHNKVLRWEVRNAIPVAYSGRTLKIPPVMEVPADPVQGLTRLEECFTTTVTELLPFGGQHRYLALLALIKEAKAYIAKSSKGQTAETLSQEIQKLEASLTTSAESQIPYINAVIQERRSELAALENELSHYQSYVQGGGHWLVVVYDDGRSIVLLCCSHLFLINTWSIP